MTERLLDTSALSALLRRDSGSLSRLEALPEGASVRLSVVADGELRYGILRLPAGRRRAELLSTYETLAITLGPMLEVTPEASLVYAEIKADLEASGIHLPQNDLWIAATALAHSLVLVATDRHFSFVRGLQVEDWRTASPDDRGSNPAT